ncbi:NAD(P)-dependent oxidoreductase [Ectobacillus panaciterrae]|uniref:NAD(P)-dependent oxidoreductase n=1 Tax=Ectobacillus panaciterrae TaxID=363872 RepID=UPI00040E4BB4|nr:NAD(P)-dependent oxidoreductase [Ectobacillus panaciterrae]
MKKIALFGATGTIGQRILKEALSRGYEVTAVVRDASKVLEKHENLTVATGDIFNEDSIVKTATGHDVVISAYGPAFETPQMLVEATRTLIASVKRSDAQRLLAVGGAGSLEVAPGLQLVDTPDFPEAYKAVALAHRDALAVYLEEKELDWTNLSPAGFIAPGERTGQYRIGTDQLLVNEQGESRISAEDYAVALLDEVENHTFSRRRFTVAY